MSGAGVRPAADWRQSVWNILTNWTAFAISALVGLFVSPVVVHSLGDGAYGAWVLLGALVGYLGLLDLGTRGAVTKYVATHHAAHRHEDAARIASTALTLFVALGVVAVAISALLALLVNRAFQVPPELTDAARLSVVICGASIAVSLVSGVFGGVIVGRQRFDLLNVLNVTFVLLQGAAVVAALRAGGGLVTLALVQLAVSVLRGIALAWTSRRVYPELGLRLGTGSARHLRTIATFGLSASALHAAGAVINYTDALVIGAALPIGMITYFAIASALTDHVRAVVAGVSQTFTPMVGALEGHRRLDDVGGVLLRGARLATLAILPMVVTLELRGESFIGLWMGPAYAEPSGAVLRILVAAMGAFAGFQVTTATMIGVNRHRELIPVFAAEALVNLGLSILLVGHLGIVGVAWGTAIPRLVISLLVGPLYARRALGVRLRAYYGHALLRPAAAMIPFAVVTHATEAWWPVASVAGFFAQVLVALPVAALGAWAVALNAGERRALAGIVALPGIARNGVA